MAWLRWILRLVPIVCPLLLFAWLSSAIQRHSFTELPGPSWTVLLLVSGVALNLVDIYAPRLPGLNNYTQYGTTAKKQPQQEEQQQQQQQHQAAINLPFPGRAVVFGIASLIVIRLALLTFITNNFQCSSRGVEYLLPIFIPILGNFSATEPLEHQRSLKKDDDYDDMSQTIWDDFGTWIWSFGGMMPTTGRVLVSIGAFLAARPAMPSTSFCSTVSHSPGLTVFSQYLALPIDAAILMGGSSVILSDKSLAERMNRLGRIFILAGLGVSITWITGSLFHSEASIVDLDIGSLTRLVIDGIALSLFLIYGSILYPKDGPMAPALIAVFIIGVSMSFQNQASLGGFQAVTKQQALVPCIILCVGMISWILPGSISSDFIVSGFLSTCVFAILAASIAYIVLLDDSVNVHPLRTRMYRARIEQDRWERYAAISQSLKVAVSEYKERHGRDPPLGFDKWYQFATDKKSVVIDHFEQIRRDMEPFWSVSKGELTNRLEEATALPNVETILVRGGQVTSRGEHSAVRDMEQIVEIFSEHLPDMDIPINTGNQPLILALWHESGIHWSLVSNTQKLARRDQMRKMELRRQPDSQSDSQSDNSNHTPHQSTITPTAFRHMIADTCPLKSALRVYHSNTRDLCISCSEPQSKSHYLRYQAQSLDLCHQPDILLQHDFHLSSPSQNPIPKLLPLFSRTKTDAFSDILIPLPPHPADQNLKRADNKPFRNKKNRLYWRGPLPGATTSLSPAISGSEEKVSKATQIKKGHTERLLYLLHNATDADKIPLLIPADDYRFTGQYKYERIRASEATAALPFDIAAYNLSPATDASSPAVAVAARKLGNSLGAASNISINSNRATSGRSGGDSDSGGKILDSRFVLVQDTQLGPPPGGMLATTLRSNGVPFVASVFREWYTERLYPWVHYVPVDLRWHGLHGTLGYFTGLDTGQRRGKKDEGKTGEGKIEEVKGEKGEGEEGEGGFYMPLRENGLGVGGDKKVGKVMWDGRWTDAEWISQAGKKWALKTIREEDACVYTFRLLLEWGRLMGDRKTGFVLEG